MTVTSQKKNRILDIFYRLMRGESLSVSKIADEYNVSTKSISRDINEIKNFLCENRELVGHTELKYSSVMKSYYLEFENFLLNKELLVIIKILLGCRAFSKMDMLMLSNKLENFISYNDKKIIQGILAKEMYHYNPVSHDCKSLIDNIWKLTHCINEKKEISVSYYKMDRTLIERRIKPIAIIFSDYYFYLIAYHSNKDDWKPIYYRIDRIVNIIEHRVNFSLEKAHDFDEGDLRNKIQFMFPGEYMKIKFEYYGPSVQAILDKIPTAKVIAINGNTKIIEAETYGIGINMFLLSQGKMIKILEPKSLVKEIKTELNDILKFYN